MSWTAWYIILAITLLVAVIVVWIVWKVTDDQDWVMGTSAVSAFALLVIFFGSYAMMNDYQDGRSERACRVEQMSKLSASEFSSADIKEILGKVCS